MASASVLQRLKQRADQADQIIKELKSQIEDIKKAPALNPACNEEEALKRDNEDLRNEVNRLRAELVLAEIHNGVKQVALPAVVHRMTSNPVNSGPPETGSKTEKEASPDTSAKKSDQQKKKGWVKGEQPSKPVAETIDITRLDFRIGKIVNVEKHPDADSLYIEEVDVGEAANRTVVSGLVKFVPIEKMQDCVAVFMCNLKPAKMRGVLSQAMIMCASTPEKVEILEVPQGVSVGDRVTFDGYPGTGSPDAQLNPKKKVWETLAPDLRTNADKVAMFKGYAMIVGDKGPVKAPSLPNVQIK